MKQIHLAVKKLFLVTGAAALLVATPAAFGEGTATPFTATGVSLSTAAAGDAAIGSGTPAGISKSDEERLTQLVQAVDELTKLIDEMTKMIEGLEKAAAASTEAAAAATTTRPSGGEYTVEPGDSLWKIASRYLGDGSRYWDLVEANKEKYPSIAKNPNLIYAGWKLTIPGTSASSYTSPKTGSTSPAPSSTTPAANPNVSAPAAGAKGGKALYAWLQRAGLSGEQLKTAWAVGMAESGGNPNAFNGNANTGDKSYGLFQINMIGKLGPARLKQYNLSSNDDLFNPEVNIAVMIKMSGNCTNWQPWSAYKNGSHKKFLSQFPP